MSPVVDTTTKRSTIDDMPAKQVTSIRLRDEAIHYLDTLARLADRSRSNTLERLIATHKPPEGLGQAERTCRDAHKALLAARNPENP